MACLILCFKYHWPRGVDGMCTVLDISTGRQHTFRWVRGFYPKQAISKLRGILISSSISSFLFYISIAQIYVYKTNYIQKYIFAIKLQTTLEGFLASCIFTGLVWSLSRSLNARLLTWPQIYIHIHTQSPRAAPILIS